MNRNVEEKLSQVEKKKNNFEEYGFIGDFEGKIYFEDSAGLLLGKVNEDSYYWDCVNGKCFSIYNNKSVAKYNLTPIKKKWYEIEENFPCLVVAECGDYKDTFVAIEFNKEADTLNYSYIGWNSKICRPATNEEVDALKIKQ